MLNFEAKAGPDNSTVFFDATVWGGLLAHSGVRYLQGVEEDDGGTEGDDQGGESTVFDFVQEFCEQPANELVEHAALGHLGFGKFRSRPDAWEKIWT